MKKSLNLIAACVLSVATTVSQAADVSLGVQYEQNWIQALQVLEPDTRTEALQNIESEVRDALKIHQDDAELFIVKGNAKLEIASALNNRRSLGYLRDGRKLLEAAIEAQPMTLDGMAEASLAAAIYWAPGWPLSYGNKKDALDMFEEISTANPDSAEILLQYANVMNIDGENNLQRAKELYLSALEKLETSTAYGDRQQLKEARMEEIREALTRLH